MQWPLPQKPLQHSLPFVQGSPDLLPPANRQHRFVPIKSATAQPPEQHSESVAQVSSPARQHAPLLHEPAQHSLGLLQAAWRGVQHTLPVQ
jgi:hypothetical protein